MPDQPTPPSPPQVVLHDYHRSSAAYRVRIALNLKRIAYRSVPVDLRAGDQSTEAYKALNPQGLVPMLEIDGLRLVQSLAIADYLDTRAPEPPLVPKDPAARAAVLAMALAIACDIHPLNNLRVLRYLARLDIPEPTRDDWYRHWVSEGFDALEAMAPRDRPYLSGETPGLADLCLVPQAYNARRFALDLARWPVLDRIDAALTALPEIAAAHPDRPAR